MNQSKHYLSQIRLLGLENMPLSMSLALRYGKSWETGTYKKLGKRGECFKNAYNLASRNDYLYVEGWAVSGDLFPLEHAWCCVGEGFENLQESDNYVFGDTREDAIEAYGLLDDTKGSFICMSVLTDFVKLFLSIWRNKWDKLNSAGLLKSGRFRLWNET